MGAPVATGLGFSAQERFLIAKTEEAIRDGGELEQWVYGSDRAGRLKLFPLQLGMTFRLANTAEGFFDTLTIGGKVTSVMGCVQTVQFGRVEGANAAGRLREFVCAEFLPRAHWTYDDGYPGGFTIDQSLYRSVSGEYGRFPAEQTRGCVDWRVLGQQYDWVLLTAFIHDFVMDFGPWRKRFKEAACVAPNAKFVHIAENPSKACVLDISVGYPFVEFAPIPNVFGFGPGKFGVAVKLYSFRLTLANEVVVRMYFAAAPRCAKVFDFGQRVPDPVYGGAWLLSRLTFGLYNDAPFHDRLDANMLAQHCRVHQALMDGVQKIWMDWYKGGAS